VAGGRSRVAKSIALQLTSSSNLRVLRVLRDFRVAGLQWHAGLTGLQQKGQPNSTRLAGPMWATRGSS
jgi:hypothetical protein